MYNFYKNENFQENILEMVNLLNDVKVPTEQANILIDCLLTADIFGVTSHGRNTLSAHILKIKNNGYNLEPKFKVVRETPSFAVIDGDNAIGAVSATYCMKYAINKVKESGVFTVFAKNNNTLGPAFYYALMAAREGLIGLVATNSPAQMAPFGGKEKMLGTNPFSAVIPVGEEDPIIIDFATSVVAKSKFKEYAMQGKNLPDGWALDVNGKPTNNAKEGIEGFILPMAGFKGYGISMLIDVLSGVLSGGAFLNHVGRFYSDEKAMNVGFYMTVIDPKQVFGENFDNIIKQYVLELRNSKNIDGQKIVLPGDDRILCKNKNVGEEK